MKLHKPPFNLEELKIEVTDKCNLTCIHCSSDALPTNNIEISLEKCLQIIDESSILGVKEISFSGGEPLLWFSIKEAIKQASFKKIRVILYTSGFINKAKEIFEILKDNGLDTIIFSLYGAESSIHDYITRNKGSLKKTIESIKISFQIGLRTEIHFVPLSKNYKDLRNVANLVKNIGIKKISVLRFVPHGRGTILQNFILNKFQYFELKRNIESLRAEGFEIRTGSPFNFLLLNNQPKCYSAINRLIITPDLRIHPCDAFKKIKAEEIVGTLEYSTLENHNLKDCWEKSPYLNSVRKYLTTDFVEPCKSCTYLDKCLSGCLAQKVILNKNFKKSPDPKCINL